MIVHCVIATFQRVITIVRRVVTIVQRVITIVQRVITTVQHEHELVACHTRRTVCDFDVTWSVWLILPIISSLHLDRTLKQSSLWNQT